MSTDKDFELQQAQQIFDLYRRIKNADFGSVPLELGPIFRGLGSDLWSDEEILEHVARHQRGDFGEYGLSRRLKSPTTTGKGTSSTCRADK